MNGYLLDTAVFVRYSARNKGTLGKKAAAVLADRAARVMFSPLIAVELEFARRKGREVFFGSAVRMLEAFATHEGWAPLPFDGSAAMNIPLLFAENVFDPFDVMISATAMAHDVVLVTCDRKLTAAQCVKTVW